MRVTADRITFVDRSGKVEIWGADNPCDSKRQGLTPRGYISYRGDTGRVVQLNEEWHAMQAVFASSESSQRGWSMGRKRGSPGLDLEHAVDAWLGTANHV